MQDDQSKAWHDELKDSGFKEPDIEKRECCSTVLFGDLSSLNAEVMNDFWQGRFALKVNFCPHCGKDMKEFRKEVINNLQETYGTPAEFIKQKNDEDFRGMKPMGNA